MDNLFGGIDCRSKCDSILMGVLRSAMDNALENVKPKDGPIQFLNESSKFYELAVILMEGGSNIVQEETDIPESRRKRILSDLMEMRQWLYERIEVIQMMITEKDKELMDRIENEMKLRHVLEMKEKELAASLHEKVKLERTKGDEDSPSSNEAVQEEGEIAEPKYSVDQQVYNMKQKLEDADLEKSRGTKSSEDEFYCKGYKFSGFKTMTNALRPERNNIIQQMSSDLDILKSTLDFVIGRVHSAEMPAPEKQWRYTIKTEVQSVLIKGLIDDIQEKFNADLRERKNNIQFGFSNEKWSELITEMTMLREELEAISSRDSLGPLANICRSISDPLPEVALYQPGEDKKTDGSHYVAKMIKSHEAINLSWAMGERSLGKGSSFLKRNRKSDSLERRMQECISKLECLISWSHGLVDEKDVRVMESFQKKPNSVLGDEDKKSSHYVEELEDEIRRLEKEADDSGLQNSMMEEVYLLLCQGLVKDFNAEVSSYHSANRLSSKDFTDKNGDQAAENQPGRSGDETKILEYVLREDIHKVFITETINSLKQEKDAYEIENLIREDIYDLVITEAVKDAIFLSKEAKGQDHLSTSSEDIPSSARKWDIDGEESLIQVLDTVLKCLELEEDLVLSASSEIEQHSVRHYLEIFRTEEQDEREAIQWLLDADESILSSVNIKLAKALKQLLTSKELLMDLEQGLGICPDDCYEDNNNAADVVIEGDENVQPSFQLDGDNRSEKPNSSDNAFSSLRRFQQVLGNFEDTILASLEKKCLRIEKLKQQLHELVHPVASLRKRKQLYKKAFIARCQSLRLAETEVDLLGDQVDTLLQFLEKI